MSISGATYFIVTASLAKEENISHIINVAGRERMLTQKISKKAIQIVYMNDANAEDELIAARHDFEQNLNGLIYGDDSLGLFTLANEELHLQLMHVEEHWKALKKDLDDVLSERGDQESLIQRINSVTDEMIEHLDSVVEMFENRGNQSLQGLTTRNTILVLFNLLFAIVLFTTWRLLVSLKKSEKKYRMLVDHSPLGIVISKDDQIQFVNKFALETLRYSNKNELIGKPIYITIDPECHALVKSRLEHVREQDEIADFVEEKLIKQDGATIFAEVMSLPFHVMGTNNTLTIFRDITEQKRSKSEMQHMFKELNDIKVALDMSNIVEITDDKGVILYANDKFCKVSKYSKEEVIGKTYKVINSGYHSKEFFAYLWKTIQAGRVWEGHVKNRAKDGSFYWVDTMIIPFINNEGKPYQYLTIRNDITDRKLAEKEIHLLATRDDLTKLANRRVFEKKLKEAIAHHQQIAVLFLDLDRFKYINDSLGHHIGDRLIKKVANRLRTVVSQVGFISRQGGDEFTILVTDKDRCFLSTLCQEIMDEIKKPYLIEGKEIVITCSIGISIFPEDGKTVEALMKNADVAMYYTKDQGKDNYSFYQNKMDYIPNKVMQMELDLRKAIEREEFVLHYQPKLDLRTDKIIGMEALIRWKHPTLGLISPLEFIPLAEETGLINLIGEWVLRTACLQNKKWHDDGYSSLTIAVNISAHQFRQANIVPKIAQILKETNLTPHFLELEITESIAMLNEEAIIEKLIELKKLGLKFAIDDFGTGYSSFKYLKKFPIDTLKIDRSFISTNETNQKEPSLMANAIISLAKSLTLEVVAEGIETSEQMAYLKKHRCDVGQGYLISRPLPATDLNGVLRDYYHKD